MKTAIINKLLRAQQELAEVRQFVSNESDNSKIGSMLYDIPAIILRIESNVEKEN